MLPLSSTTSWLGHLPNKLTLARMLVIPVLLVLYPVGFAFTNVLCALIFAAAGVTDILDGYLARKYGQESKIGALLDPVADKMLSAACLLLLADSQSLPAWICGFLLCRDIAVSGMRLVAAEAGHTIEVSAFGKIKTIFQDVAIFSLMIGTDLFEIPFRVTGMICIWLAMAISLYSGYLYLIRFLNITNKTQDF